MQASCSSAYLDDRRDVASVRACVRGRASQLPPASYVPCRTVINANDAAVALILSSSSLSAKHSRQLSLICRSRPLPARHLSKDCVAGPLSRGPVSSVSGV